ncbi:SubName: Full=Uncharacterized protein {ECO:0000313/EMBL:CCA70876.1} [Serendipita indica DSM 11827]|nr:SubName: Full=Uncharacterized protein {ECO:0000313/EMBL:CCA70876.1} [Serendipita indica DSM 11827]
MDATDTRPYLAHHQTQVEINKAVLNLFLLVDRLLQSDKDAQELLVSLRTLSDGLQRRGLISPMPAEPHEFYENATAPERAFQSNPLLELWISTRKRRQSKFTSSACPLPHRFTYHNYRPILAHTPIEGPFPDQNQRDSDMDASYISVIREKLKAWRARSNTRALWTWVSGNLPSPSFTRPRVSEEDFEIVGRELYSAEERGTTRTSPLLPYGASADIEQAVKEDLLSVRSARDKPLPPPPGGHIRSKSLSSSSPRKAPLQIQTTSLRPASSQHRGHRKPVRAYADVPDKPSAMSHMSPVRMAVSPITPSPLRRQLHLHDALPTMSGSESSHQDHTRQMAQLIEGHQLDSLADRAAKPMQQDQGPQSSTRGDDPNDPSDLRDVSGVGRTPSLSRRSRVDTGNNGSSGSLVHRRDVSRSPVVTSAAPLLLAVEECSHWSEDKEDHVSEFLDRQEVQEKLGCVTVLSGQTHGEDLEGEKMGKRKERMEKRAGRLFNEDFELKHENHEASPALGDILADIAARRKPVIRSHGSGSLSSQRPRTWL